LNHSSNVIRQMFQIKTHPSEINESRNQNREQGDIVQEPSHFHPPQIARQAAAPLCAIPLGLAS
jgi:hypothetical protein